MITSVGTPMLEAGHRHGTMLRLNLLPRCAASICSVDMQQAGNGFTGTESETGNLTLKNTSSSDCYIAWHGMACQAAAARRRDAMLAATLAQAKTGQAKWLHDLDLCCTKERQYQHSLLKTSTTYGCCCCHPGVEPKTQQAAGQHGICPLPQPAPASTDNTAQVTSHPVATMHGHPCK